MEKLMNFKARRVGLEILIFYMTFYLLQKLIVLTFLYLGHILYDEFQFDNFQEEPDLGTTGTLHTLCPVRAQLVSLTGSLSWNISYLVKLDNATTDSTCPLGEICIRYQTR